MTDRHADAAIDARFLDRWSPRAFDGSAVAEPEFRQLVEAARWAPSAFNEQPWRFLYAIRDTADWQRFLNVLVPFNQSWVRSAGAILIVVSDTLMGTLDGGTKPSHSHSFDAGAAWAFLALQAHDIGLHTHAMTGLDFDAARAALGVPDRFRIECAIAVGRIGDPATLPEALRAREMPSGRRPACETVFAGDFSPDGPAS